MSPEEKKKRYENYKTWISKQTDERKKELNQKAKEYHKNRYQNRLVKVTS